MFKNNSQAGDLLDTGSINQKGPNREPLVAGQSDIGPDPVSTQLRKVPAILHRSGPVGCHRHYANAQVLPAWSASRKKTRYLPHPLCAEPPDRGCSSLFGPRSAKMDGHFECRVLPPHTLPQWTATRDHEGGRYGLRR